MPFLDSIGIDPMSFLESENGPEQAAMGAMGAMYGGEMKSGGSAPALKMYKKGGKVTKDDIKLRRGEHVVFDPQSQRYIIVDKKGRNKGFLNVPASANAGGETDLNMQTKAVESGKPTMAQNIPKDAIKHDPSRDDYDECQVEAGDYIIKKGRWYLVKGKKVTPYNGTKLEDMDPNLSGGSADLRETYGRLEEKITGSKRRCW